MTGVDAAHAEPRLAAACPAAWAHFNLAEYSQLLRHAIALSAAAKPYAVCPACRGADMNDE